MLTWEQPPQWLNENAGLFALSLAGLLSLAAPSQYKAPATVLTGGGAAAALALCCRAKSSDAAQIEESQAVLYQPTELTKEREQLEQLTQEVERSREQLEKEHQARLEQLEKEYQVRFEYLDREREQIRALSQQEQEVVDKRINETEEWFSLQREELSKEIAQAEQRLEEDRQALAEQFEIDRQGYELIIAELQQKLALGAAIKRPKGNSRVEWFADQVVSTFWDFNIEVDYADSAALPGIDHVWLDVRKPVKLGEIRSIANELPSYLDCDPPSVEMSAGTIHLSFKYQEEKAKKDKSINLIIEGFDYFTEAIVNSNHHLVNGPTGGGKSTLVSNLIDAASQGLIEEIIKARSDWNINIIPEVETIFIDPKYPRSTWRINGKIVKPQYRGFERWTDPSGYEWPSAYDGIQAMDQEIHGRLERAMEADYYGKFSSEKPLIYVSDESEQMVSLYGKEVSSPLLFVARVGRSELVCCIIIGQSSNCSAYGFQKPNLKNFTRWFTGDLIDAGIDEVVSSSVMRRKYRAVLDELRKEALTDESKRFYALIKIPGRPAFFAYLPPPGYFANQMQQQDNKVTDTPLETPPAVASVSNESIQSETITPEELEMMVSTGYSPVNPTQKSHSEDGLVLDTVEKQALILQIKLIKEQLGTEVPLTQLLPLIWPELEGIPRTHRKFREHREKYRELTGE